MTTIRRESWTILLVFLHLFVVPCATAMVMMPADMDCDHCQTINGPDDCAVASAATYAVIAGVAFDSGRADPPLPAGQDSLLLPIPSPGTLTPTDRACWFAPRHGGDPPLYLVLGQLRL